MAPGRFEAKAELGAAKSMGAPILAFILLLALDALPAFAQSLDSETPIYADGVRLERPTTLAVSPSGEQIAVADPQTNRIAVIDYLGRPLWSAGGSIDLGRPLVVTFTGEDELLFTRMADLYMLRVTRDNATALDTIIDLATVIAPERRLKQLTRIADGWLALDEKAGEILRFDEAWQPKGVAIKHGSGKGKVLVPTSIATFPDGRFIVTDEKNYPAQLFSPDGKFLMYFGWSSPGEQRGWEAVSAAIDGRNIIWIADRTAAAFRLFDASGGEVTAIPFPNPLFRPVAMTATIDNRVLVLEETGRAIFYQLQ